MKNQDDKLTLKKEYNIMKKPVPENAEEKSEMEDIILGNFCSSGSGSDCTGLVPHGGVNEKNEEAYRDVYPYAVPVKETEKATFGEKGTHGGV